MPVQFDMSGFERAASNVGALQDQVAFAVSQSLNDGLFAARDYAINTSWPKGVSVRDPNFMRAALRVDKASKRTLAGAVTTEKSAAGKRAHIAMHETGGTKRPTKSRIAIPDRKVLARRSGRGVPKSLRPGTAPNTFRRGDVIYQVTGRKKDRKLKLLYTLKASAPIKGTVPFHADFDQVMRREVANAFPGRIRAAMKTRRR